MQRITLSNFYFLLATLLIFVIGCAKAPKLYDFIQWLLPQVAKFPRSHKFTLGDRIINLALDT